MKQNNVSTVRVEIEALSSQKTREGKVSVDKEDVLHLLSAHGVVETAGVEDAEIRVEDVL